MSFNKYKTDRQPCIVGTGLAVLDIILNNSCKKPIFNAGGTCANVLSGLSYLGWKSVSVARVGTDLAGEILVNDILSYGVDVNYITKEVKIKTPRIIEKLISNDNEAQHKFLLRCPECNSFLPRFRSPILDSISGITKEYPAPTVYFFDRVTPFSLKLAKIYRNAKSFIVFEPNALAFTSKMREAISLSHVLKYAGNENVNKNSTEEEELFNYIKSFKHLLIIKTVGKQGLLYRFAEDKGWGFQDSYKLDKIVDSCGAGDWCTIGFLFYLNQLALQKNISLIDSLNYSHIIESSLKFGQALALLSLNFVGACGLTNSIDPNSIVQKLRSLIEHKKELIPYKSNKKLKTEFNIINDDREICSTCLMKNR